MTHQASNPKCQRSISLCARAAGGEDIRDDDNAHSGRAQIGRMGYAIPRIYRRNTRLLCTDFLYGESIAENEQVSDKERIPGPPIRKRAKNGNVIPVCLSYSSIRGQSRPLTGTQS